MDLLLRSFKAVVDGVQFEGEIYLALFRRCYCSMSNSALHQEEVEGLR